MSTEATKSSSNQSTFEILFNEIEANPVRPGDLIEGTIAELGEVETTIESAAGSGKVPTSELGVDAHVGDSALYFLEERTETGLVFSKSKADHLDTWNRLEKLIKARTPVTVTVIGENRGGLSVSLHGMKALLDTRDIDPGGERTLEALKGTTLEVCVTRIVEKKNQVFVSQRALTQGDPAERKAATLATLSEGSIVDGEVRRFAKFGAFVDIGGIDGLLHVKDISWRRINHPSEALEIGDLIQVKVLSFDEESEKIALGLKQMQPDPWLDAEERYAAGTVVEGNVVGLTDFGAFIMMPDGIEGLVHVSEMSWTEKVTKPGTVVKRNDLVKAWVLRCETDRRRLGLTLRDPAENPWIKLAERLSLGEKVTVPIVRVVDFGIFVALGDGLDGLIHVSDFSWAPMKKSPSELYEVGQEIEAMVLEIDAERGRANLGIKHLSEDLTAELIGRYAVGDALDVRVTSIQSYGVFAELEPGLEGLIHVSALGLAADGSPEDVFETGQVIQATISAIDDVERRISLGLAQPLKTDDADGAEELKSEAAEAVVETESEEVASEAAKAEAALEATEAEAAPEATEAEAAPEAAEAEAAIEAAEAEAVPEAAEAEAATEAAEAEVAPEAAEAEAAPEAAEAEAAPEAAEAEAAPEAAEAEAAPEAAEAVVETESKEVAPAAAEAVVESEPEEATPEAAEAESADDVVETKTDDAASEAVEAEVGVEADDKEADSKEGET